MVERLRSLPGVETVALAGWPLLSDVGWNGVISVGGAHPAADLAYFLNVSPGWADAMKIPFIDGRDFRPVDTCPGAAIVNQAFAKRYFESADPVGKLFDKVDGDGTRTRFQVVGWVRDARYRNMREPITPTAYVPIRSIGADGALQPRSSATFVVRTVGENPAALASVLRHEVPRARPEFRVTRIRTQTELLRAQTLRERLLAMLALFFGVVALLLAAVGLYGVLDYSVLAAAAGNRDSHGHRRTRRQHRAAGHAGDLRHGVRRRPGGTRAGHGIGAIHRHAALPGECRRSGHAGASIGDYRGGRAAGGAAGGVARYAHRSGRNVACGVKERLENMSLWSRIVNVVRGDSLSREIDEEVAVAHR